MNEIIDKILIPFEQLSTSGKIYTLVFLALLILVFILYKKSKHSLSQKQKIGKNSTGLQAGNDIKIN